MAFQLSPGVNVSEVDLTTVVPSVSTTAGAFAGQFQWGPVGVINIITNETDLVSRFGKPSEATATSFFTAANFLAYGNNLQVARAANTLARNATANGASISIKNEDVFEVSYLNTNSSGAYGGFVSRYPGALGNSISVSVCANSAAYSAWTYKNNFAAAPNTSSFVANAGGAYDQLHVAVIDDDGLFSGTKGTILELWPFLSKAADAANDDGSPSYYKQVIFNNSKYVYAIDPVDYSNTSTTWGQNSAGTSFFRPANITENMSGGTDPTITDGDITTGFGLWTNADSTDISLVLAGAHSVTVQQYIIDNIATTRKDCLAFISPRYSDVVNQAGSEVTNIQTYLTTLSRATSYAVLDSGWKYQFDKYNNKYRYLPLNADIAGLCAQTDQSRDPWFSPAGFTRGAIKNCVKLAWNPKQTERDTLYNNAVNPVVSFPGQGTVLYGDKTLLTQPSVFNRINVRRLFIVLEKSISTASKFSLFEFNDEFTRAQFVALVEPFLRDIKGRRGIYDYRVVCDTTNNTPQVIDSNQFIGDIYIKPARSINFIQLNFVAVRSGVEFNEVVGAV